MGTERGEFRSINPIRPEESLLLQVFGIQARSFLKHSRWNFPFCSVRGGKEKRKHSLTTCLLSGFRNTLIFEA